MGIWRILSGKIYCDNCGMLIATLEFDASDEPNIGRVRVWCLECRKPSPTDTPDLPSEHKTAKPEASTEPTRKEGMES